MRNLVRLYKLHSIEPVLTNTELEIIEFLNKIFENSKIVEFNATLHCLDNKDETLFYIIKSNKILWIKDEGLYYTLEFNFKLSYKDIESLITIFVKNKFNIIPDKVYRIMDADED